MLVPILDIDGIGFIGISFFLKPIFEPIANSIDYTFINIYQ